jgi:hypothetical protein
MLLASCTVKARFVPKFLTHLIMKSAIILTITSVVIVVSWIIGSSITSIVIHICIVIRIVILIIPIVIPGVLALTLHHTYAQHKQEAQSRPAWRHHTVSTQHFLRPTPHSKAHILLFTSLQGHSLTSSRYVPKHWQQLYITSYRTIH